VILDRDDTTDRSAARLARKAAAWKEKAKHETRSALLSAVRAAKMEMTVIGPAPAPPRPRSPARLQVQVQIQIQIHIQIHTQIRADRPTAARWVRRWG
jgi:hypothetical protein